MDYELIRNERVEKDGKVEIFICLEIDDGVEVYNFGYWLKPSEVEMVEKDKGALDGLIRDKISVRGQKAFNSYKVQRSLQPQVEINREEILAPIEPKDIN
jgi:hypothetical protein